MSVEEKGLAVRTGEVCYEGAAGTGKTRAILQKFHLWAKWFPGVRFLILRDFRDGHTQSTMKTLQNEVFDPEEWGDATSGKPVRWHAGETAYLYDNGSTIVIKGLRDSRGIYSTQYDCIFVNEAGSPNIDEEDYDQLLRAKRNLRFPYSLLITDLNPEYEMHWLHQRCDDGATVLVRTKHSDNPAASAAYIHDLFSMRDPVQLQRLAKGERVASVKGAYYQDSLNEVREGNRIKAVLYQKGLPVHTAWDLGRSDYTAIWLFQRFMGEWHFLDYYESHLEELDHYWGVLTSIREQHGFVWGTHCLPHDATQKTLASLGQSVQSQLWKLGMVGEVIVPQTQLNVQRNAVRAALSTSYFDNSRWVKPESWHRHRRGVRFGVQRLLTYRAEHDERLGVMKSSPAHDLASHGASAFATGILAAPTHRSGPRAEVVRDGVDYLPRSNTTLLTDGYRRQRTRNRG